jgi:hypothetical protein
MSFPNEPPAQPSLPRRIARPWDRPETEFPVPVPVGTLPLYQSERSTIAVSCVLAYSNGFEFFVTSFLRPGTPVFAGVGGPARREPLDIGVEFADGGQVFRTKPPPGEDEPAGPILHFGMGVGNSHRSDSRWWMWPLPPAGQLDFICRLDGAETRASMDAQLILDAAQQSVSAWPST